MAMLHDNSLGSKTIQTVQHGDSIKCRGDPSDCGIWIPVQDRNVDTDVDITEKKMKRETKNKKKIQSRSCGMSKMPIFMGPAALL